MSILLLLFQNNTSGHCWATSPILARHDIFIKQKCSRLNSELQSYLIYLAKKKPERKSL